MRVRRPRRYLNVRLRNRTEELLGNYIAMVESESFVIGIVEVTVRRSVQLSLLFQKVLLRRVANAYWRYIVVAETFNLRIRPFSRWTIQPNLCGSIFSIALCEIQVFYSELGDIVGRKM